MCGYCGESLVQKYFQRPTDYDKNLPIKGHASGIVACLLGTSGTFLLLAAEIVHFMALCGFGPEDLRPLRDVEWLLRGIVILLPAMGYLGRRIALGWQGGSLVGEGCWLIAASAGFTTCFLFYWEQGESGFYGFYQIPYLCTAGCGLLIAAQLAAIGNSRFWRTSKV